MLSNVQITQIHYKLGSLLSDILQTEVHQYLNHRIFYTRFQMASKLRNSSSSFANLLLTVFNLILFVLASASVAPIFLLKNPPSSLGWGLLMVSCASLVSSLVGFCSLLTTVSFVTYASISLASSIGQLLAILPLFTREKTCLQLLNSARDPKEALVLVRIECGILMCMLMMQLTVLLLSCAVHSCWVREFEGLEIEREHTAKKRSRNMARVQEESMANAAKIAEVRAKELDEKMMNKYGKSIKIQVQH